jgi:hypothetical protein
MQHGLFSSNRNHSFSQVWAYLSAWALSRRYDLRPAMPEYTLNRLSKMFDRRKMNVPSLRTLGLRCGMLPWLLHQHRYSANVLNRPKDIFRKIQLPRKDNVTLINSGLYTIDAFFTVPLWNELSNDLVILPKLRAEANQRLRDLRRDFYYSLKVPLYKNKISGLFNNLIIFESFLKPKCIIKLHFSRKRTRRSTKG